MDGFLPPGLVEVYAGTMATHVEEPGPCLGLLVVPWLDRGIQVNNCAYRLPGLPFVSWTISLRHIWPGLDTRRRRMAESPTKKTIGTISRVAQLQQIYPSSHSPSCE